jgi:predicted outer membrane protein
VKRSLTLFLLLITLLAAGQAVASAQPGTQQLSYLDGELLTKVKLAGLWEIPAGSMAQERSSDPRVQEVGRTLVSDHTMLDDAVGQLAASYGHPLPSAPNDVQKSWLTEMATSTGAPFDAVWAMRLRSAHGMIFPLIAQVRAETTDPEIRKFASTANTVVLKHMAILESTNNVDYAALADPTPLTLSSDSEGTDMVVAIALLPLLVAVAMFVLWLATSRNRRREHQPVASRLDDEDEHGDGRNGHRRDDGKRSRLFVDR